MPPYWAFPVVVEVAEPVRGLHQWRACAAGRVGKAGAIARRAESDLLHGRGRRVAGDRAGLRRFLHRRDELISASVGGADEALAAPVVPDRLTCRLDPAGERRLAHET